MKAEEPQGMLLQVRGWKEILLVIPLLIIAFVSITAGRYVLARSNLRVRAWVLVHLGRRARRYAPFIARGLLSDDPVARVWAGLTMLKLGEKAEWGLGLAINAAKSADIFSGEQRLVFGACLAGYLRKHRPKYKEYLPELCASPFDAVRAAAALALNDYFGVKFPYVAEAKLLVRDQSELVVRTAAEALAKIGVAGQECYPELFARWKAMCEAEAGKKQRGSFWDSKGTTRALFQAMEKMPAQLLASLAEVMATYVVWAESVQRRNPNRSVPHELKSAITKHAAKTPGSYQLLVLQTLDAVKRGKDVLTIAAVMLFHDLVCTNDNDTVTPEPMTAGVITELKDELSLILILGLHPEFTKTVAKVIEELR